MSEVPERLNAERWYVDGHKPKPEVKAKPETAEESKARLTRQQAEMQAEMDEARSHNTKLVEPILDHILSKPDSATYFGADQATIYQSESGSKRGDNRITQSFLTIERGNQSMKILIPEYDTSEGLKDHVHINPRDIKPELSNGKKVAGDYPGLYMKLSVEQKKQIQSAIDLAGEQSKQKSEADIAANNRKSIWQFWKK